MSASDKKFSWGRAVNDAVNKFLQVSLFGALVVGGWGTTGNSLAVALTSISAVSMDEEESVFLVGSI